MIDWLSVRAAGVSYPRRQQVRRLSRAGAAAMGATSAALLGLVVASTGAVLLAAVFVLAAVVLGFSTRYWVVLAERSGVGAQSEDKVRRELVMLAAEGWRVRHSLRWSGRGDIDSVAIAPGGFAFAIEVKTSGYDDRHLVMVREQAAWLRRFRRRWCRQDVVPVLCVVRSRGVQRWEDGVLVLSIDRLIPAVRWTANLVRSACGSRLSSRLAPASAEAISTNRADACGRPCASR